MKKIDNIIEVSNIIKNYDKVFIMGHKDLDLDALASCYGIAELVKSLKKEYFIIIDDKKHEAGVNKILTDNDCYTIINTKKTKKILRENDLLIVLDCNKCSLVQSPDILNLIDNILIIDHHMISKNIINNALCYIDLNKSSTSEIVSDILIENNIKISSQLATILLSGIVLDTNNFILKTTKNTFLVAYKLVEFGARTADVQYLLKQDIKAYKMRQKIIVDFMIIDKNIAVSVGNSKLFYRKEDLAKVADTLLQFNNIETSFAIGRINKDYVGVSGRSNNYMNVGLILEKIGGGGNLYEGAANLLEKNPKKVKEELIKVLKGDK